VTFARFEIEVGGKMIETFSEATHFIAWIVGDGFVDEESLYLIAIVHG